MKVRFWGTRGSLPIALTAQTLLDKISYALVNANGHKFHTLEQARQFALSLPFAAVQTFGGHSSCVEIELANRPKTTKQEFMICDLGTGLRPFGNRVIQQHGSSGNTFHFFVSHLHWDHIMGFPLFTPAYIPGNTIRIYGCHENLELAFRRQHAAPSFPVEYDSLDSEIEFVVLKPGHDYEIANMQVTAKQQLHAGDSYGYRFEYANKALVYSTDAEHKLEQPEQTESFVEFFSNANLVIFDAMYSLVDAVSLREDWGHSSNMIGVELCQLANVKHLVLYHHEPINDDHAIAAIEAESKRLEEITRGDLPPLKITSAFDGLELEI